MPEQKIVAMYRIKNEERWIKKSLEAASEVCQEIVILDDCSTDNTVEICKKNSNVVEIHERKEPLPLDESRDRKEVFMMALKRNPDYVLSLDADQILAPNSKEILNEELNVIYPEISVFEFQVLYMWDTPKKFRSDGWYESCYRARLFKIKNQAEKFEWKDSIYPGNLHCNHVPSNLDGLDRPISSNVKILEHGFYDKKIRQKKFEYYEAHDPYNITGENQLYIISGKGYRSGPNGMEFKKLPENLVVEV